MLVLFLVWLPITLDPKKSFQVSLLVCGNVHSLVLLDKRWLMLFLLVSWMQGIRITKYYLFCVVCETKPGLSCLGEPPWLSQWKMLIQHFKALVRKCILIHLNSTLRDDVRDFLNIHISQKICLIWNIGSNLLSTLLLGFFFFGCILVGFKAWNE